MIGWANRKVCARTFETTLELSYITFTFPSTVSPYACDISTCQRSAFENFLQQWSRVQTWRFEGFGGTLLTAAAVAAATSSAPRSLDVDIQSSHRDVERSAFNSPPVCQHAALCLPSRGLVELCRLSSVQVESAGWGGLRLRRSIATSLGSSKVSVALCGCFFNLGIAAL